MSDMKHTCGAELEYDPQRKCWRCPKCSPATPKLGRPVLKPDENRVREIVAEEIGKFFAEKKEVVTVIEPVIEKPKTWQEEAKDMDINPYGRKKEIVLAEMAEKTRASQ